MVVLMDIKGIIFVVIGLAAGIARIAMNDTSTNGLFFVALISLGYGVYRLASRAGLRAEA